MMSEHKNHLETKNLQDENKKYTQVTWNIPGSNITAML